MARTTRLVPARPAALRLTAARAEDRRGSPGGRPVRGRQTQSIERAVEALGLKAIAFGGSDNPDAVFQ